MKSSSVRLPFHAALAATLALSLAIPAEAAPILADARLQLGGAPNPYAHFLVGRYAMTQGDIGTASAALSAASLGDPANNDMRERAFLVSILSGNIDSAAALAPKVSPTTGTSRFMVPMIAAITAIKAGKGKAAQAHLEAAVAVNGRARAAVLLQPYVMAMAGQWKKAVEDPAAPAETGTERDTLLTMLIRSERARLNEIHGRYKEAEAIYAALYQPGAAAFIFGPDYAGFLERRGRKAEARAIWAEVVAQSQDTYAQAALKRIDGATYSKPALPDVKQSMAQALFLAATLSFSERDNEMALATSQMSLYLDPSSERTRILLGQVQQELRDPVAAEAAWASIPLSSPYAGEATLRRVWSLRTQGQTEAAISLTDQALARDPDHLGLVTEKASLLHEKDQDAEALALLDGRIARVGNDDFSWQTWFLLAMLYDGAGQWDQAEMAINKARAINGTQPEILNFLGYGWINQGIRIDEGMDLVRQALKVNPKSGAMLDSLGWGYYRKGDYEQALTHIEQAILYSPSDAEINEHLGDVYKALGRDIEATYEWQRVLTLDASEKQAAGVRRKLEAHRAVTAAAATGPVKVTALNEAAQTAQ